MRFCRRPRPDGKWRARYRDPSGREHARHFRRKLDAQRWLDSQEAAKTRGEWLDPALARVPVSEWAGQWLAGQSQLKASTRERYEGLLRRHVLPRWGSLPLASITHADVVGWVAELAASGLSASTVRHAHRVFAMLLGLAVRDGRLSRNPAERVSLPRVRRVDKRFLDHDQVAELADAAGPYRLVVLVLAYCGLRFAELAALRVRRVDLLRRRLEVAESVTEIAGRVVFGTPKTDQRRWVPLPRSLATELGAELAGKGPDDLVFTSPEGGPLRINNFRTRCFDPAAARAGLPGLTPHELRHTAASLAVSAGANVKAVQRLLGHASASMTLDVYSGLFDDDLEAVADLLDAGAARARADCQVPVPMRTRCGPRPRNRPFGGPPVAPDRGSELGWRGVGRVGLEPTTDGL
jgi:integrase